MAFTNDEVLAGLAELITDETGISADEVALEKSFTDDLDIDSISMMTIVVNAEEKFGVTIPDEEVKNLKTGNGRIYNDATVQQILQFHFAENRQNVGIYGITGAGKSYFLSACCVEACRRNYRCKFVDYCDLLDELIILNRQEDLNKYRKRIKYYARIQLLFIDDFSISRYTEEGIKILYHLLKLRDDLGTSTLFSCQYSPDEWGNTLSYEPECYGKLDGIRRRLTTGFTVFIEKA